ncbi:hypothetical protein QFC21_000387 [Naganishia friedmannii]|uniref:Uncharacterized protein n=1 Tax=Naganishia friedmannii TaxID=89922 RepID=A0ACC2WBF1_9TREE|nr:hypothetical protein QFC21_000387 [Naganishia friedmannii]
MAGKRIARDQARRRSGICIAITPPLDLDTGTTSAKPWAQHLLSERLSQLHEAYQPAGEEAVTLRANEGHLDTTLSLINETHHVRKRFLMITEEESEARSDIGRDAVPVSKSSARRSRLETIFLLFSRVSNYYTKGAYGYSVLPCATYFSEIAALSAIAALQWLDDWPVGLKLNAPLSKLFSGIYAGVTTTWLCEFTQVTPMTCS